MALFAVPPSKPATWPISVGAEGIAAAQFARCGFDVLVQAGRDKPWYDLVVTRGGNLLKVSVKASENGQWSLTSGYTRRVAETSGMRIDCRSAVDMWRASHGSRTICCLVQFEGAAIHELPRIYLASPDEIAARMRDTADRTGQCSLFESYEWTGRDGTRNIEALPSKWNFSPARILELLAGQGTTFAAPRVEAKIAPVAVIATPAVPEIPRELVLAV
ncbi:MAG TPA: hypothetical protein VG225_12625 [Terracidiphilus sp.]|jgi:hypothetical protein|nr:hypothetical protein [Terracidiphilus sp.]